MIIRKVLGVAVLLAVSAAVSEAAAAPDADELCVQAFLDFKGVDVGPLDGAAGRKTFEAAARYKADNGLTLDDLGKDNAAEWCAFAKADPEFAVLLGFDYDTGPLWKDGPAAPTTYDQVLLADSAGQYEKSKRSITNPEALGFVGLEDGLVAARVQVRYKDKGHREDWGYDDATPGAQQRFELVEKPKFWMKPGETYWNRFSVFVTKGFKVYPQDQLVLSDLKAETNGNIILDPLVEFKLNAGALQLNHHVGLTLECIVVTNEGGGDNTLCKVRMAQDDILPLDEIMGRWVDVVYRVHWSNDVTGTLHVWVDDKFIAGYQGINAHGADSVQNKFGVYRGYYGTHGQPQVDARVYFAGVGRSQSCAGLGLANCEAFERDATSFDKPGVIKTNMVVFDDVTPYLDAGGKVKCTVTECNW